MNPNGTQANSEASSNLTAVQTIANMRFISDAWPAILNEIANGSTQVNLMTYVNCNLQNLQNYYGNLGFSVGFPFAVYGFFSFQTIPQTPTRMVIGWTLPTYVPPNQVISDKTANYTMTQNNELVYGDTTNGAIMISLPSSPQDGWVETINCVATASPLTISGNGHNIDGSSNPLVLNTANSSATLLFTQSYGWSLFPNP